MPEFRTEPLVVPTVSGLLPDGERNRRVARTVLPFREERPGVSRKEVCCYECGRQTCVPAAALSALCLHCHAHLNMGDVLIKRNSRRLTVRTLGNVTVASGAVLSQLSIVCHNLSVKGQGSGSFRCTGCLSFSASVEVDGSVAADQLCIERGCRVSLAQIAIVNSARIRGQLRGKINAQGGITIARGGVLIGDCEAASLCIEPGGRHEGEFTQRG